MVHVTLDDHSCQSNSVAVAIHDLMTAACALAATHCLPIRRPEFSHDTPEDYVKLVMQCWDPSPGNR